MLYGLLTVRGPPSFLPIAGMFDTVWTLLQLFFGESWDAVMKAAEVTKGQFMSFWFELYIVLVTLLFANLLIGVIIDGFTAVSEMTTKKGTSARGGVTGARGKGSLLFYRSAFVYAGAGAAA